MLIPCKATPHARIRMRVTFVRRGEMDPWVLTPVPQFKTACGQGYGVAACPSLGLLVTSDVNNNTLSVWSLPSGAGFGIVSGLVLQYTLGGKGSRAPMHFIFRWGSGCLAFTPPPPSSGSQILPHLLFVTDAGHNAVHIMDVRGGGNHVGYLAPPGSIAGPRGVAVSGVASLAAVSAWNDVDWGDRHMVFVYRGSDGSHWTHVRTIGGGFGAPGPADRQLRMPLGLRFSADGSAICVAVWGNDRLSMFRVGNGGFMRHITTGLRNPRDVEEVEGGWLVANSGTDTVEFVNNGGDGGRPFLGKAGGGDGAFCFLSALALVPGLGLIVREWGTVCTHKHRHPFLHWCVSCSAGNHGVCE